MGDSIQIKRKHYIALVWHILEKYFQFNPEQRSHFSFENGTKGIHSSRIAFDLYFYIIETCLQYKGGDSHSDKFNNIISYIYNVPASVENSHWDGHEESSKKSDLPALEAKRQTEYTKILNRLKESKKELNNKENTRQREFNKAVHELGELNNKSKGKLTPEEEQRKEKLLELTSPSVKAENELRKNQWNYSKSLLVAPSKLIKFLEEGTILSNFGLDSTTTELSKVDLEVLTIYAFDMTFEEFIEQEKNLLSSRGKTSIIFTGISNEFDDVISNVLEAFEIATNNGGSKNLLNSHVKMFEKQTKNILEEIKKGTVVKNRKEYLQDLHYYIEKCSAGVGVNIPQFGKEFNTGIGKEILNVNKKQAAGYYSYFNEEQYTRIFFLDSKSPEEVSKSEKEFLLTQHDHDVDICVLLINEVKACFPDKNIVDLDFALLRVTELPTTEGVRTDSIILADSFMDHSSSEDNGIFYSDKDVAIKYYYTHLKELLESKTLTKYTFQSDGANSSLRALNRKEVKCIRILISEIIGDGDRK